MPRQSLGTTGGVYAAYFFEGIATLTLAMTRKFGQIATLTLAKTVFSIVIASMPSEQTCLQGFASDGIHKTIGVFI